MAEGMAQVVECYSTCLANMRSGVQTLALQKKKKKREREREIWNKNSLLQKYKTWRAKDQKDKTLRNI
jgi:hypothetical protein